MQYYVEFNPMISKVSSDNAKYLMWQEHNKFSNEFLELKLLWKIFICESYLFISNYSSDTFPCIVQINQCQALL